MDPHIIHLGQVLNLELQASLCKPSTTKDIKEAIFSISNHKFPGPDGFSSGFFKQKTAYEIGVRLVGSEMCIRDS